MTEIRELPEGRTDLAAAALLELRPRWSTDTLVELIDERLRPAGYRLVGGFDGAHEFAVAALGFREAFNTAWGHHVYVDDVSTLPEARGHGHAEALLTWVIAEARRLGCEAVHLDSGVGAQRAAAHRLYMRNHFAITSHHFTLEL
ncbi:GNAT family N-acetyltransferase [Nocardia yamanashiensis]|uniref:GNAT family N-acetyltransferase n=1 Tax=Nocardia yamanashiensis TaxID=209247 RepID=UPI001E5799A6|nr:GNAT family N-acetyltransferase [Nocardia yamanashiensis]UGT43837.1 GNAT family N-acetyltransferase [Nocardia yamanashiensis]